MQRISWVALVAGLVCGGFVQDAQAQMFGGRSFGTSLQPQQSAGGGTFGSPTPAPGIAPGGGASALSNARFNRDNRSASSFVGKDSNESRKVVGVNQSGTAGGSQPAALELFERKIPESLLNPSRPAAPRNRMYEPKLTIAFPPVTRPVSELNANLQTQVNQVALRAPNLRVRTIVVGETVHLQGEVSSESEKALIEQLMLFEPGISSVQNDLKVLSVDR